MCNSAMLYLPRLDLALSDYHAQFTTIAAPQRLSTVGGAVTPRVFPVLTGRGRHAITAVIRDSPGSLGGPPITRVF